MPLKLAHQPKPKLIQKCDRSSISPKKQEIKTPYIWNHFKKKLANLRESSESRRCISVNKLLILNAVLLDQPSFFVLFQLTNGTFHGKSYKTIKQALVSLKYFNDH